MSIRSALLNMSFGADGQWVVVGWLQRRKAAAPGARRGRGGVIGGRGRGCGYACLVMPSSTTGLIARLPGRVSNWARTTSTGLRWSIWAVPQAACGSGTDPFQAQCNPALPSPESRTSVVVATALWMAAGMTFAFIGIGSDEYRRVLNAGVSLTAAIAIFSYAMNPSCLAAILSSPCRLRHGVRSVARYSIRKHLHHRCGHGPVPASTGRGRSRVSVADLVKRARP